MPSEQQQPAERQGIRVDHPLQAAAGESQGGLNVRQRDVDDGRVEHDHQLGGRDDQQGQAEAAAAVLGADLAGRGKCRCHTCDAAGRTAPVSSCTGSDFFLVSRMGGRAGVPRGE